MADINDIAGQLGYGAGSPHSGDSAEKRMDALNKFFGGVFRDVIEPVFEMLKKICAKEDILCCQKRSEFECSFLLGLNKVPSKNDLHTPTYYVVFIAGTYGTPGEIRPMDYADRFEICSFGIDRVFYEKADIETKRITPSANGNLVFFRRSTNFTELNEDLIRKTLELFFNAYLKMTLRL